MMKSYVFINTTKEFFHRYKNAPEEVWYLRNLHRHLLHIQVKVEVFTTDREIEFIMLKHGIDKYLAQLECGENCSCETVAMMLVSWVHCEYGENREVVVQVSEDGENGAEIVYRKEK